MNKLEQEAAKIAEVEVDMMQQTGYITIREVEEYKKRLKEKIFKIMPVFSFFCFYSELST